MALLEVKGITGGYGAADILHGVSLSLEATEIISLIGPNGAGKSTVMKAIFGLLKLRSGSILLQGEDIVGLRPDEIVRKGMCYVPQEYNIFPSLTIQENLEMGAFVRSDDYSEQLEMVFSLFPPLKERRRDLAGNLSGGQRQMVAMGRALMLSPDLLLLDEPSAGLAPLLIEHIFELIVEINKMGVGVLMVEQNAKQALEFSNRGYVLVMGENRYEDTGDNLLNNQEVVRMFLGG